MEQLAACQIDGKPMTREQLRGLPVWPASTSDRVHLYPSDDPTEQLALVGLYVDGEGWTVGGVDLLSLAAFVHMHGNGAVVWLSSARPAIDRADLQRPMVIDEFAAMPDVQARSRVMGLLAEMAGPGTVGPAID